MLRSCILTVAVSAVLLPSIANAQAPQSRNPLAKAGALKIQCEMSPNIVEPVAGYATCVAYMQGFLEGLLTAPSASSRPLVCMPNRYVATDELRVIFLKWVEAHPEQGQEQRNTVLLRALKTAFPCKVGGKAGSN